MKALLTRNPIDVRDGVLLFIEETQNYCDNFGDQWNRFRKVQIDSVTNGYESRDRFFAETGWDPEELKGKILLDAGCGTGRFAEIALEAGARVIAVDLSEAVYACRDTLSRFPKEDYLVLRADLFDLPLHYGVFDGVYSLGVLHHTPTPLLAIDKLAPFLKPGGRLAAWIYEKYNFDYRWLQPRTWIRILVANLDLRKKMMISTALATLFFPCGWLLSWLGRWGERAAFFLPYASRHHLARGNLRRQLEYSVMDTLDWYGPVYDLPQKPQEVVKAMENSGLDNICRRPTRGMAIVGEKPFSKVS